MGAYGHPLIDTEAVCVTTRVRLRHCWRLPAALRLFRGVRREASRLPELQRMSFLVASPRAFYVLSLWSNEAGLLRFGTHCRSHLRAVRWCLRHARRCDGRPEIWSAQWKVWAASNNICWPARGEIADADFIKLFSPRHDESRDLELLCSDRGLVLG